MHIHPTERSHMATQQPTPVLEILAPAGDFAMLRAAVFSGADAVYVGVQGFNARRPAANFGPEELAEAVAFCHARNCKVYAALNTLVQPKQQNQLTQAVLGVAKAGCDAIIVQDLATALVVRSLAPQLALHASTQMSVHSLGGVQQLARLGFSRAILARELSAKEIQALAGQSPIELEVFVHGALCVSVSGQCMMSSFLGGRSANKGACAGPCRLPFQAGACYNEAAAPPRTVRRPQAQEGTHHLSLKDLSVLDALPRLAQMGVVSAKIEGRLRGPEYCAFVVDCARKALHGQPYDKTLLGNIFSRDGFTDGWYAGKVSAAMFGTRSAEDSAARKKALPAARELYRREMPRVPVCMEFTARPEEATLRITDGINTLCRSVQGPFPPAAASQTDALYTALAKMGGTPFYAARPEDITIHAPDVFVAGAQVSALRRELLEELLALRSQPRQAGGTKAEDSSVIGEAHGVMVMGSVQSGAQAAYIKRLNGLPLLRARFKSLAQMPSDTQKICSEWVLPLSEAAQIPENLRSRTWLWLPRMLFGAAEEQAAKQVKQAQAMGFAGFEAGNLGHLSLCAGSPVAVGFGLNLTNSLAAGAVAMALERNQSPVGPVTLSPELTLRQMADAMQGTPQNIVFDSLAYGYMPLMITRACPLQNPGGPGVGGCKSCPRKGTLADRKGESFYVACNGPQGVRTIYNPVVLWMADELASLPTHTATLYFTHETPAAAAHVLQSYAQGSPAQGNFTRGLYHKGTVE